MKYGTLLSLMIYTFFATVTSVNVTSSSYTVRRSTLLGDIISVALFEVDLSEDLYITTVHYCLPGCNPNTYYSMKCSPCDYTTQGPSCGSSEPKNNQTISQKDKSDNTSQELYDCPCTSKEQCDEVQYPWTILEEGVLLTNQIVDNVGKEYRFHFDKPCHGIHIRVLEITGRVEYFLEYEEYGLSAFEVFNSDRIVPQYPDSYICPNEWLYNYGTWHIRLWSIVGVSNVSISLEYFESGQESLPVIENDSSLIEIGKINRLVLETLKFNLYQFNLDTCKPFLFHTETVNSPSNSSGILGVLFAANIPPLTERSYTIAGTKPVLITFCPTQEGKNTYYYITLINIQTTVTLNVLLTEHYQSLEGFKYTRVPLQDRPDEGVRDLEGIASIFCSTSHSPTPEEFPCYSGCSAWPACCIYSWPLYPSAQLTPFYPVPSFLRQIDSERYGFILNYEEQHLLPSKVVMALLLEILGTSSSLIPLPGWEETLESKCYLKFPLFSHISTINFEILNGSVSLKNSLQRIECQTNDFANLSKKIEQFSELLPTTSSFYQITTRFQIDELTFTKTWQDCDSYVQSFLVKTQEVVKVENSTFCSPEMYRNVTLTNTDACCSELLEWSQCCKPRSLEVITTKTYVPDSFDKKKVSDKCQTTCLNSLLEDYIFYDRLIEAEEGCSTAIQNNLLLQRENALRIYRNCKGKVFGSDGYGIYCEEDKDCSLPQTCDIFHRRCVFQNDDQYQDAVSQFYECYQSNAGGDMLSEFLNRFDGYETLVDLLRDQFTIENCVTDYGRSLNGTRILMRGQLQICDDCPEGDCMDEYCDWLLQCEQNRKYGRPSSLCAYRPSILNATINECTKDMVCNWNFNIPNEQCLNSTTSEQQEQQDQYACVACYSPTYCLPVPNVNSEEECLSLESVCLSSYGELLTNLTETECSIQYGSCSLSCSPSPSPSSSSTTTTTPSPSSTTSPVTPRSFPSSHFGEYKYELDEFYEMINHNQPSLKSSNQLKKSKEEKDFFKWKQRERDLKKMRQQQRQHESSLCTKEICENIGRCSQEDYVDWLESTAPLVSKVFGNKFEFNSSSKGICITDMNPWNNPDCSYTAASLDIPLNHLCLSVDDSKSCKQKKNKWLMLAKQKEECENLLTCSEPLKIYTRLTSAKNQSECSKCKGETVSVFDWDQGSWIAGVMSKTQWIKKSVIPINIWTKSVDFISLASTIVSVIDESFLLQLETELSCRLNPKRYVIEQLLTVCPNETESSSVEESKKGDVKIGVSRICSRQSATVVAPPAFLTLDENSVSFFHENSDETIDSTSLKRDQNNVIDLKDDEEYKNCIDVILESIMTEELRTPSKLSLANSFRDLPSGTAPVLNQNSAIVGQIGGPTGISLKFSRKNVNLSFSLCLYLSTSPFSSSSSSQSNSGFDSKYPIWDFGKRISESWVLPLNTPNITVNEAERKICGMVYFKGGDEASFIPIRRLVDWEVESTSLSSEEKGVFIFLSFLYLTLFFVCFIREISLGLGSYKRIRVINPFFLVICFVRGLYFAFLSSEVLGTGDTDLADFIFLELPTFCFFDATVIATSLWYHIVTGLKKGRSDGLKVFLSKQILIFNTFSLLFLVSIIVSYTLLEDEGEYTCEGRLYIEPDTSQQDSLRITYRIIVAVIAIVIMSLLVTYSVQVHQTIGSSNMVNKNKFNGVRQTITIVSLTCAISLLCQCLFFIFYSSYQSYSYEYSLFLIPIEWIPSVVILFMSQSKSESQTSDSETSIPTGVMSAHKKL